MKTWYTALVALVFGMIFPIGASAQQGWPKTFTIGDGRQIKVYEWQPESLSNGSLQANAAISVSDNSNAEPVFGMIWLTASTSDNGNQIVVRSVDVNAIKLPGESDDNDLESLQSTIANLLSGQQISFSEKEINNALQMNREQERVSNSINNSPPQIIYSDKPSLLVVIDGSPKLERNSKWGVETVVNTPFVIVKNNSQYYLYGGKHWYVANAATGPYAITTSTPSRLSDIQSDIAQANKNNNAQQEENDFEISTIIVSTTPAELLQSSGEPNFTSIPQTNLLYVRNSRNDIFMDVSSQQYYVLLSGRWYKSQNLSGKWNYVASDKLPSDFAKIPEGSPKDNVLTSVAGTLAANDAVMNAQVPQTARVDRKSAVADIQYDGNPRFDDIEGTDMAYAVNSPDYVIRWRGAYYAVENGVWFQSYRPDGPWVVSEVRPYAVSLIPPRYPVYAMKYVYIYDITPDYIYMGYTPGYLNAFIYGPTVVYGTGYHYRPWYGRHYYARPYTWGFNMHYNPWTGWGFGFNYNFGWFHMSVGNYGPWGWGGWWGPAIYRPSFCPTPYYGNYRHGYYSHGYYGNRNTVIVNNVNIYHNNNIYNNRRDVVTRDNRRSVAYNRSAAAAPVRQFDNARPVERTSGRNINSNARPVERRTFTGENNTGRNTSGRNTRESAVSADNNQNSSRPSRRFDGAPATGNTERISRQRPSERINNGERVNNGNSVSRPGREQLSDRRADNRRQETPTIRTDATRPSVRQPDFRSENRRQQTTRETQAPVRRNSPEVRTSAPQRTERSIERAPSPSGERRNDSRPSVSGERRAGRG